MKTTYLDYYKTILDKVSFDRQLFMKEYNKALRRLQHPEQGALKQWLQAKGLLMYTHPREPGQGQLKRESKINAI